jgi:integrase
LYAAQQIRDRPLWVAKKTGIEKIGYLDDVKRPEKLPTFEEIESVWKQHFSRSAEQKRRVLHAWADFKRTTGVAGVKDIKPETAIAYRDAVYARKLSAKMHANIFSRIRRLFTFASSREIAPEALGKVIDALKRLVPSGSTISLDPQPISRKDFQALIAVADEEDRAMLLLMLNGAYYCAEVVRLCWSMIQDGCIITHRSKEGRSVRVCVLWKETKNALARLSREGDYIFTAYTGRPLGTKGAEKRFRKIRSRAKISSKVTSSHLRDGAATAMVQAGVSERLLAIAMGHRSGISDHYVKRNPMMVAPACKAVHDLYFR